MFFTDSQKALIKEELFIDPVSGLPLHHLTFIVKHVFPLHMFYKRISNNVIRPVNCVEDVFFHFLGTQADESVILLKNIHRNREPKSENNRIVVFVTEKLALFSEFIRTTDSQFRTIIC